MVTALGVDVETIPAWLYFVGPMITLMIGALATTVVSHYRKVQKGDLIPRATVDLLIKQYEDRIKETDADRDQQVTAARAERDEQVTAIRAEVTSRMDNFRADHAIRTDHAREDHERQLAALVAVADGIRADRDSMLAQKQRDADDWRGAYHLASENAKASEARMDEVLETVRLTYGAMNALRTIAAGRGPELSPGDH